MESLNYIDECTKYLEQVNVSYTTYLDIDSEPTDVFVLEALNLLKQNNCDLMIAIGGGSCIDTAKAVALLATNGGDISEYIGNQRKAETSSIPLIAVPTTAGTGSEATDVTVITNTKDDIKMMIKQPTLLPKVALVDPDLTVTSPPNVTAATGIDALTHAIEAYISRKSHPFTDSLALSAIKQMMENIQVAYQDGSNIEAREKMSLASMQAGVAFSNASVCLVHGMSRPIGALFHVPHGISNAMLLPGVLEFTKSECLDRLAEIGRFINPSLSAVSDEYVAEQFVGKVKKLCYNLNIPNLKDWGIDRAKFLAVCRKMAKDAIASGSPANNPKIPSEEEIIELYHYCYEFNFKEIQCKERN